MPKRRAVLAQLARDREEIESQHRRDSQYTMSGRRFSHKRPNHKQEDFSQSDDDLSADEYGLQNEKTKSTTI